MRTTLIIDDQLAMAIKDAAHRSGQPFKQMLNEALRKGLQAFESPEARPYRLVSASMGAVRPDISLDKALSLADE